MVGFLYGYLPMGDTSRCCHCKCCSWSIVDGQDEDEKKQKPVLKMLKIIWGIAVVLELIPTIYKIYNM